ILHSDPTFSNSGLLLLALAYHEWAQTHRRESDQWKRAHPGRLGVENSAFLESIIASFEDSEFRDSKGIRFFPETTASVLDTFRPPHSDGAAPDIAFVYESCALQNLGRDFKVIDLSPTVVLETRPLYLHLRHSTGMRTCSDEQERGAHVLCDFLM